MSSAADILKALRTASLRKVNVAGLDLYVRGLTGAERRLLAERAKDGTPLQPYEVAALAVCTDKGERFFTEAEAAELADVDGGVIEKIAEAVLRASGLLPEAQDEATKN